MPRRRRRRRRCRETSAQARARARAQRYILCLPLYSYVCMISHFLSPPPATLSKLSNPISTRSLARFRMLQSRARAVATTPLLSCPFRLRAPQLTNDAAADQAFGGWARKRAFNERARARARARTSSALRPRLHQATVVDTTHAEWVGRAANRCVYLAPNDGLASAQFSRLSFCFAQSGGARLSRAHSVRLSPSLAPILVLIISSTAQTHAPPTTSIGTPHLSSDLSAECANL